MRVMSTSPMLRQPALVATCPMWSGLGNRLRFVLSCQAIADAERREFYYHWPTGRRGNSVFGARFDELWKYHRGIRLEEPGPEPMIGFSHRGVGDLSAVRDEPILSLTGDFVVKGYGNERDWSDLLADLEPTDEVVDTADAPLTDLAEQFVGVQVRAHPTLTHPKSLAESPVSWFIARMQELRSTDEATQFFLSCDTAEAQEAITRAVPGVVSLRKTGEYNSRRGLVEAVADLVILSQSNHILAPYWSSFAHVAWLMARKRMVYEDSARIRTR